MHIILDLISVIRSKIIGLIVEFLNEKDHDIIISFHSLNIDLYYWSNITIFTWFFLFNFLLILIFHLNNSLHQLHLFKFCVTIISWMTSLISFLKKTFKFFLSNFKLLLGSKKIHSRVVKPPSKNIFYYLKVVLL